MIQSTITRYFQKDIVNNLKKEIDMDSEKDVHVELERKMDVEVKRELVLNWDEVDNCYGQMFFNVDEKYMPKVVLEKLPDMVWQKYNLTKDPAPEKNPTESLSSTIKCVHFSHETKYKSDLIDHLSSSHKNEKNIENPIKSKMTKFCEKCNKSAGTTRSSKCKKCFRKLALHCAKCNKKFKTGSLLRYHWYTRCGVKGYYNCPQCDFKSVWRTKVVDHMKRSHTSQDISEEFKNIEWLDLKIEKENSESDQYRCTKCTKPMGSSRKLAMHVLGCGGLECTKKFNAKVNRSVESEAFKCSTCSKVFSHIYSLNRHIQNCMGRLKIARASDTDSEVHIDVVENEDLLVKSLASGDKSHQRYAKMTVLYCEKCQEDSPTEIKSWRMDMKVPCHKCNQTLFFKCRKCLVTKSKYRNLKSHFDNVCNPQEIFRCTKCYYKSFTLKLLKGHYDSVHETVNVACNKCGKKFKRKSSLKSHLVRCGVEPKFQCAHCPFKGLQKESIKNHLSRMHMERIHIIDRSEISKMTRQRMSRAKLHLNAFCSKCKKEQILSKGLKICKICRIKLYYKCKICKNKYDVDDENACAHVKTYLETIKFECKHCGKGTLRKNTMLSHQRVCGSTRMFKCRFCKYAAKYKSNMMYHEKTQHPHQF